MDPTSFLLDGLAVLAAGILSVSGLSYATCRAVCGRDGMMSTQFILVLRAASRLVSREMCVAVKTNA